MCELQVALEVVVVALVVPVVCAAKVGVRRLGRHLLAVRFLPLLLAFPIPNAAEAPMGLTLVWIAAAKATPVAVQEPAVATTKVISGALPEEQLQAHATVE